jgi:3-phosphoglycerate kinase
MGGAAPVGTKTLMVVLELMDDTLAWVCGLENSQNVELFETENLKFISKGGGARCKRLQPKVHRFPMG